MFHFYNVCFEMILCDCNTAFPFIFWYANIHWLWFSWCWSYALIKNVFHSVFPLHWTTFFLSATTWKFLILNNWSMSLLWLLITWEIFSVQLKLTLTELRLSILCNLLFFGKCLSNSFKKILAMLVTTLLLQGGLNQIILRFLCLLLVLFTLLFA